jgi:1-pyrroline-5-carboxylate dehydrogenase
VDAITRIPQPVNEPVHDYAPGSPERERLVTELDLLANNPLDIHQVIGGEHRTAAGPTHEVVQPHNHASAIGSYRKAAAPTRRRDRGVPAGGTTVAELSYEQRASVFLRAADLLSGPWRERLAAATMLGQSKTAYQAEIDTPCELIDFWRFNVAFGRQILEDQPISSPGVWNRVDYRPLEGFVYAITPFNFSAIAGNLPTAPALMGNTVLWKASPTQAAAAYVTMQLLEAAGLPAGVINLVFGDGPLVSDVALNDPRLAGIHFTGSTATFQTLWQQVGNNLGRYHGYPRLVGETGGKDFVVAHSSADPEVLTTALIRGAFDYQGQKCSAASRAFVPESVWRRMGDDFLGKVADLRQWRRHRLRQLGGGDRSASLRPQRRGPDRAKATDSPTIAAGGATTTPRLFATDRAARRGPDR